MLFILYSLLIFWKIILLSGETYVVDGSDETIDMASFVLDNIEGLKL
jgi:hypothetical protein